MLYVNIILLGISSLAAILKPNYIQNMAKYQNQEVLIVDWGIYAFSLVLIMISKNINNSLLFCYLSSIIWNYHMYKNKKINVNSNTIFFKFAFIGNLLGISEILFYKIKNFKK